MPITHTFVSGKTDGADATQVQPSNWNADHTITDYIELPTVTATPSPPASGVRLHTMSSAGRNLVEVVGPSGVDVALQPALFGNNVTMWLPGTAATAAINYGVNWTTLNASGGTLTHPALTSTSGITQMKRGLISTGTTSATGASGICSGAAICWRGNASGLGGFYFFSRFGIETYQAAVRVFVGLSSNSAVLAGEPSSTLNNSIGVCKDSTDTTWQLMVRSGTTTTKTNTTVATAAGDVLDLHMFCKPNDSQITILLVNTFTGVVLANNTSQTTNLPTNTTFLFARADIQSTVNTTAETLALNRIYVETDT